MAKKRGMGTESLDQNPPSSETRSITNDSGGVRPHFRAPDLLCSARLAPQPGGNPTKASSSHLAERDGVPGRDAHAHALVYTWSRGVLSALSFGSLQPPQMSRDDFPIPNILLPSFVPLACAGAGAGGGIGRGEGEGMGNGYHFGSIERNKRHVEEFGGVKCIFGILASLLLLVRDAACTFGFFW